MGLLSRIGQEWGDQVARGGSRSYDLAMGPPVLAAGAGALGGGVGAALGAAGAMDNGGDPMAGALSGAAQGGLPMAAMMGGVGALASGTMAMKQIITAIARALKQQAPQASDEMLIGRAQQIASQAQRDPNARQQLERIIGPMNWDQ